MFAFLSHQSACEALRMLDSSKAGRWPDKPRKLPLHGDCLSTQGGFTQLAKGTNLETLGLTSRPVNFLVPSAAARSRGANAQFHVWARTLPANSFFWACPNVLVSGPELVILQLCSSHAKLDALLDDFVAAVRAEQELVASIGLEEKPVLEVPVKWERVRRLICAVIVACEFAGTYRLPVAKRDTDYDAQPIMTRESLRNMALGYRRTSVEARALKVADLAFEHSRSPMETALALMLTLPVEFGGFGLPRPTLNGGIDVSAHKDTLSDRDFVEVDMLWKDVHVAVEYDSWKFHGKRGDAQLTNDAIRANILTGLGYATFCVTPGAIRSLARIEMLARQIARCLHFELVEPSEIQLKRRTSLYLELMPKVSDR